MCNIKCLEEVVITVAKMCVNGSRCATFMLPAWKVVSFPGLNAIKPGNEDTWKGDDGMRVWIFCDWHVHVWSYCRVFMEAWRNCCIS